MEQTFAKSNKWRLHSDLLKQFSCLVHCVIFGQIYSKFVLLLFRYVCFSVSITAVNFCVLTLFPSDINIEYVCVSPIDILW